VDEKIFSPTLEITISAKVIFEFAKRDNIHVRHNDVHICARKLPDITQSSSLRSKRLWRGTCNVEVTLTYMSAALAAQSPLPSSAGNKTFDMSFTRPFYLEAPDYTPPPFLPSDVVEEHVVWLSSPHICGLTIQQARFRLTSLLCEMWRQELVAPADPRPVLYAAVDDV
jgi:hypothetical protein